MFWRIPRSAQTDIPCKRCKTSLEAKRSCHEVTLWCPICKTSADVREYADKIDDKFEAFMDMIPSDRT